MPFTKPKASQIDFDVTNITDPLIRLNSGESGSADKDVGIVIERGSDTNAAIIYDESADEFVVINTSETGTTSGNVTISSYADLRVAALRASSGTMTGAIAMGTNKITGMGDPTSNQDAATKAYVDSTVSGISSISNIVEDTTPQLGGNLDVNTKNINFGDSASSSDDRLNFGAGTDLSIYHDGSDNTIITNSDLNINASGEVVVSGTTQFETKNLVVSGSRTGTGGAVSRVIWRNRAGSTDINANSAETRIEGWRINGSTPSLIFNFGGTERHRFDDDGKIALGAVPGSIGSITETVEITGTLSTTSTAKLNSLALGGTDVTATATEINKLDGVTATTTELNYVDLTTLGTVEASKAVTADANGDVTFPDNENLFFGTGSDLKIFHNGSNSFIREQGTGDLKIQATSLSIEAGSGEEFITATANGAVEIYHDDVKKFETTSDGATVTGKLDAGIIEGKGGVTYDPPGSSGTDTATDVAIAVHSGDRIVLGENGFIRTIVDATWGSALQFGQSGTGAFAGTEIYGGNSGVTLKHSTNTKFVTTSSGATLTGTLVTDGVHLGDNEQITLGADSDLVLLHNGSNSVVKDAGTGNLSLQSNGTEVNVWDGANGQYMAEFNTGGAVNLYHNGTSVFSTTSTGVSISNTSTDDALLITTTEDSSSAGPVITLKRNSSSPADADYLGQIKFKGENDADQENVYAKITGKILDASDGTEDGLIEFANKKAGSNVITARLRSDSFQLLNSTNLSVAGTTTLTGNVSLEAQADLQFYDSDSSHYVGFQAPATISSSVLWTLPNTDGTDGQIIKTDGAGTLSWTDNSGGGGSGSSFPNSTFTTCPASDGSDFDLSFNVAQTSQETPFEASGTDAFGVNLGSVFSLMDPVGQTNGPFDMGALT